LGLAGCGAGSMDDLQTFVAEAGKDMQGKIEPLPEVKVYEPFTYDAFDLPDPFKPRKLIGRWRRRHAARPQPPERAA
jgi:type IV pilus assembly protein PilP